MDSKDYGKGINRERKKLPEYVTDFVLDSTQSNSTKYEYLKEIRHFFEFLITSGIANVDDIKDIPTSCLDGLRKRDIMVYINGLSSKTNRRGHTNAPSSVNRSLNALRTFFKYMTITSDSNNGQPFFKNNVMLKIESRADKQTLLYRARNLSSKMYKGRLKLDFINYIDKDYPTCPVPNGDKPLSPRAMNSYKKNKVRDIAIVALLSATGVRVSEAANSNLEDLSISTKTLAVLRKGGQMDSVPIAPWAIPYIENYLSIRKDNYKVPDDLKAIFVTNFRGQVGRMTVDSIEKMIKKYSTGFGRPITPHKLRHTLASEMYDLTKDQVLVAQQLGQKGTSATALYTHVDETVQRNVLGQIGRNTMEEHSEKS